MPKLPDDLPPIAEAFKGVRSRINALLAAVRPWTNVVGRGGVRVTPSESNVVVELDLEAARNIIGATGGPHPFELFDATESGTAKVTCTYGTVTSYGKNIVPKIGATFINAATPPKLTVTTGDVYFKATVDTAGNVTALVIENAVSTPDDTATKKYRTITTVDFTDGVLTITKPQSVQTSLNLFLCGGTAIWERA